MDVAGRTMTSPDGGERPVTLRGAVFVAVMDWLRGLPSRLVGVIARLLGYRRDRNDTDGDGQFG